MTSTDFSLAKLGHQICHDVIFYPHIPVPKHGKPWTSKMVMFTANASQESASKIVANGVSPKSMLPSYGWKMLKHLETKHDTTFFETLPAKRNHVENKTPLDIHLENHGENQGNIWRIGLHHTLLSRSIKTEEHVGKVSQRENLWSFVMTHLHYL